MDKKAKRVYTPEFKKQALDMLATGEYSMAKLEKKLGITAGRLAVWKQKAKQAGKYSPRVVAEETMASVKAKLLEVENDNARLIQEREILKKAVAIFSNPKQ
jgi:transposase